MPQPVSTQGQRTFAREASHASPPATSDSVAGRAGDGTTTVHLSAAAQALMNDIDHDSAGPADSLIRGVGALGVGLVQGVAGTLDGAGAFAQRSLAAVAAGTKAMTDSVNVEIDGIRSSVHDAATDAIDAIVETSDHLGALASAGVGRFGEIASNALLDEIA